MFDSWFPPKQQRALETLLRTMNAVKLIQLVTHETHWTLQIVNLHIPAPTQEPT
jgi:hypothetical protein